jgi:hypothetical protein
MRRRLSSPRFFPVSVLGVAKEVTAARLPRWQSGSSYRMQNRP